MKKEVRQLKPEALPELKDKLWSLKTDLAAGKVKNVKEIKKIKKNIARILTWQKQNQQK